MVDPIVDYDARGYDYRGYWTGRDYERWAERRALLRIMPRLGKPEWFVDLGGGFGRNAEHYQRLARNYVLADYSATNLRNAARTLAPDIEAGRAFPVRCDLNALPFADNAFDAGMVIRVLHHLPDLDHALPEMGRTISGQWLLDVPIKHHVLGTTRAAVRGHWSEVRGPQPLRTGTSAEPFWNYRLSAVRQTLAQAGWQTEVLASVNNLRRWDRRLPTPLARGLWPAVAAFESVAQTGGRGWWGPSQFVLARRSEGETSANPAGTPEPLPAGVPQLATRAVCPDCRGGLRWTPVEAFCGGCGRGYRRNGHFWDFTI